MRKNLDAVAGALAMTAAFATHPAAAADFPGLSGVWSATYQVVAASTSEKTEPRFDKAEWRIEIKQQKDNLFWGISSWRFIGEDKWNDVQLTGSLNLLDTSTLTMVEKSPNRPGAKGLIDAKLSDGKIYANFKGVEFGISFSAVLEKSAGN